MDYRERLRALREDRDLSQQQVAEVINKSQQGYSHIENGRAELKIEDLKTLCAFYEVSSDYLIGTTDDPGTGNTPQRQGNNDTRKRSPFP